MSVYVSNFDTWEVIHDDAPDGVHVGTIDPATIIHTKNIDDSGNHNFLIVNCPVCDAVSTHPAGGGAQPLLVQQLFVEHAAVNGCPCGAIEAGDNSGAPDSHVRLNCNRMDGPGRWQLDNQVVSDVDTRLSTKENSDKMFQVVYRDADSLIVGLEPNGGVGPNNKVAVIHDMAEYEILCNTDPAYLSADKNHIVSEPPV